MQYDFATGFRCLPRDSNPIVDASDDEVYASEEEEEYKRGPNRGYFEHEVLPTLSPSNRTRAEKNLSNITRATERYNIWASALGSLGVTNGPWVRGKKVLQARKEVDDLLDELDKKVKNLTRHTKIFVKQTTSDAGPAWYRNYEDLTDLESRDLRLLLFGSSHLAIDWKDMEETEIYDFPDYVDYLCEMLPRAAKRHGAMVNGRKYYDNVKMLVEKVEAGGSWSKASKHFQLRLVCLCKAQIWRWDSPRSQMAWPETSALHDEANYRIPELLEYEEESQRSPYREGDRISYWNYALAFRTLWEVWEEPQLDHNGNDLNHEYVNETRKHLKEIWWRAQNEVRCSTYLALGRIRAELPTELKETIWEITMAAEGVPIQLPAKAVQWRAPKSAHDADAASNDSWPSASDSGPPTLPDSDHDDDEEPQFPEW